MEKKLIKCDQFSLWNLPTGKLICKFHTTTNTEIQKAFEINSHHTELLCSQFDDRTFIIVTQYNKLGTLVKVTRDNVVDQTGASVSMISTDVLMGIDEPMTHVVARNLVAQLNIQKPVVLSMALKDNSPQTVKSIAKIIPTLL